jgi:hypothetical protein
MYCALAWGVREFPDGEVPLGASYEQDVEAIPAIWQDDLREPKRWAIYMPMALPTRVWEPPFDCVCYFRVGGHNASTLRDRRLLYRDEMTPPWYA